MADRGLSAGAITELGADSVEFYHLIRIDFDTPLYYTDAPYDISYDDGDGAQTYLSNGSFKKIPNIKESLKIKPQTVTLSLSGAALANHALMLSENYKNADVYITRYLTSTPEGVLLFKGFCDSFTAIEKARGGISSISLTIATHWADWESTNGRVLDHHVQTRLHPGDLGLEYSGVTMPVLRYWGWLGYNAFINSLGNVELMALTDVNYDNRDYRESMKNAFDYQNPTAVEKTLPVIYGQKKVIGIPVFRTVSGLSSQYLWVVYAVAEGECDSLVNTQFQSGEVPRDYNDAVYGGSVELINFHSGVTTTANNDTDLIAETGDWTTAHTLKGICYVVIKYNYKKYDWQGDPQPIFEIKGKKLFDPRTSTTAYSNNPALVLYDYLTSASYGKALAATDLNSQSFQDAATYAETTNTDHDAALGGTPVSIKLFEFHGTIDNAKSIKKNTESILFSMRGHLPWVAGEYTLVIERDDDTSVYTFDEDNIKGEFRLKEAGIKQLANIVYYEWVDGEINEGRVTEVSESAAFLAADNNRQLSKKFSNPFEINRYRAKNRAATELKKTRQQIEVTLISANSDSLQVQCGEVVDITRTSQGWTNKEFRVSEIELGRNGTNKFVLQEYEPTVYDWDVSVEEEPPTNTELVDPNVVTAPSGLILTSGTSALLLNDDGTIISRIKVEWTAPADAYVTGYRVYVKQPTDPAQLLYSTINDVDTTEIFISPVDDGVTYTVYVAAINTLGIESTQISDTELVVGKTAPPDDVTGFFGGQNGTVVVLKWNQVSDIDLAGYEIRYGKLGESSWEDATPLTTVTRGTNITSADIPPNDWDVYIKAVDTSGNYSVNAASISLTITSAQQVIAQNEQAPTWSGTLVNFILHHTGVLVPDSQNLASDDDWETFDQAVVNPFATCTYEAAEDDIDFDDTVRVWADIQSSLMPDETGVANPQYNLDYKLDAGAYDGFEDWSIGQATGRYFKHKLTLTTADGIAYISGFKPTIDKEAVTLSDTDVVVAAGGSTVTFSSQFHNAPFVRVFVKSTTALFVTISNITATGFDVDVFNSSGSNVGGTIDWEATGD